MSSEIIVNEKELILLVSQGNEKAFATMFDQYREAIYQTAFRITDSASTAEDILQEVFLTIWLNRQTLPEIQYFKAYLMTIARNLIINAFKRSTRLNDSIKEIHYFKPACNNNAANTLLEKENDQLLKQAIARLPARQAQVYLLSKEQGLTRDQVAVQLNVNPETVKTHIELAMKKIRAFCQMKSFLSLSWGLSLLSCLV